MTDSTQIPKAPVALFLWRRPDQTRVILSEIIDYKPPQIYIVIDGPRNMEDLETINKVKEVVIELMSSSGIPYKILAADQHMGLNKRFRSGFDWIFQHVEEVIILEDDTIPSPAFFLFCNFYLDKYRHNQEIVAVNGSFLLSDQQREELVITGPFLKRLFGPWGWATWKYKLYDTYRPHVSDLTFWIKVKVFARMGNYQLFRKRYKVLKLILDGKLDVWAVQLQWNILEQNKFVLCSHVNLITNTGFDNNAATQKVNYDDLMFKPISNERLDWRKYQEPHLCKSYERMVFNCEPNRFFLIKHTARYLKYCIFKRTY